MKTKDKKEIVSITKRTLDKCSKKCGDKVDYSLVTEYVLASKVYSKFNYKDLFEAYKIIEDEILKFNRRFNSES